jgi:hypothetical protein
MRGIVPRISWAVTGEDSGDLAALIATAVLSYPVLLGLCAVLPAPPLLGGKWFTLACLIGASTIGVVLGGMFTPTTEGEAQRFGSLGSFIAGLGGALLIAAIKKPLVSSLQTAVSEPQYTGPVYVTVVATLLAASITVVARKTAADHAMRKKREQLELKKAPTGEPGTPPSG